MAEVDTGTRPAVHREDERVPTWTEFRETSPAKAFFDDTYNDAFRELLRIAQSNISSSVGNLNELHIGDFLNAMAPPQTGDPQHSGNPQPEREPNDPVRDGRPTHPSEPPTGPGDTQTNPPGTQTTPPDAPPDVPIKPPVAGNTNDRPGTSTDAPGQPGACTVPYDGPLDLRPDILLQRMIQNNRNASQSFEYNVRSQGFIGATFDWLKNNLGSSGQDRSWYNPLRWWSNILDYDSGSDATRERIRQEREALDRAQTNLQNCDLPGFQREMEPITIVTPQGYVFSRSMQDAQRYDQSQQRGVDVITDLAVIGAMLATRGAGGIPGQMLLAAVVKGGLKYLDGRYFSPSDPFAGAALIGGMGIGRLAGNAISGLIGRLGGSVGAGPTTTAILANLLGFGTEGAVAGGTYNGVSTFGSLFFDFRNYTPLPEILQRSAAATVDGAMWGYMLGFLTSAGLQTFRAFAPRGASAPFNMERPVLGQTATETNMELRRILGIQDPALMRTELNTFLQRRGMPPISDIEIGQLGSGTAGIYYPYSNSVGLSRFYRNAEVLGHELTHHEQNYLRFRLQADAMNLGPTATQQQMIDLSRRLGIGVDAIEEMMRARNGVRMTPAEAARAQRLQLAEERYPTNDWYGFNPRYWWNFMEREARRVERIMRASAPYGDLAARALTFGMVQHIRWRDRETPRR
ncbi:MAG: proline-rich domain-containing protein [Candidatus Obscuribacterales bacterium]